MAGKEAALGMETLEQARSRDGQLIWRQIELFCIVTVAIVVAVASAPIDPARAPERKGAISAPQQPSAPNPDSDPVGSARSTATQHAPPQEQPQHRAQDQVATRPKATVTSAPTRLLAKTVDTQVLQTSADADLHSLIDLPSDRMLAHATSGGDAALNNRQLPTTRGAPHTGPPR